MKKILSSILASSILLSNLSLSFATETTQTNPQEEIPQQISTQTLSATLNADAAAAYVGVIENIVNTYGENPDTDGSTSNTGLGSAFLCDLDNDGTDELFVVYATEAMDYLRKDYGDYIPPAPTGYIMYTSEIWTYTSSGLQKIRSEDYLTSRGGTALYVFGAFVQPHQGKNYLVEFDGFSWHESELNYTMYEYQNATFTPYETFEASKDHGLQDDWTLSWNQNGQQTANVETEASPTYLWDDFLKDLWVKSNRDYDFNQKINFHRHDGGTLIWGGQNCLPQLQAIASSASVTDQLNAIKAKLPYTGNLSTMNMTAEQALAMAEQMETLYAQGHGCYVALFDDGTRVPALATIQNNAEWSHSEPIVPEYNDSMEKITYMFQGDQHFSVWDASSGSLKEFGEFDNCSLSLVDVTSEQTLLSMDTFTGGVGTYYFPTYSLNGGLSEIISYSMIVVSYTPVRSIQEEIDFAMEYYGVDFSNIIIDENHIRTDNSDYEEFWVKDGFSVPYDGHEPYPSLTPNVGIIDGYLAFGNWANAKNTASLLRQYAELSQFRFQLPEFSQNTDITSLFDSLNLQGTLLECYQVTDNFYYVIMDDNGTEKGYLICAVKENGEVVYRIVHESAEILAEDALVSEGNHYAFDSNINIEFDALKDFTVKEDYVSYFTKALQNITGIQLNDQGKSALVLSMQDSIVNFATYVKNLSSETGEIRQAEVAPLVEKSNSLYQDFLELLRSEEAELNKEIEQTVRVVLQGLDEKNWTIYLNPDLIGQLEGNHLQIFLSSGQQGVEISADDLEALLKAHNGLFINVQETGSEQYAISFADGEGNHIEKLENAVKIFLPTSNEFSTVILEYAQGTENWGGQFNADTNTIQFSTIHSGSYLIVDNSVEIHDVSDEYLSMVQFMVSKGFFTVDDDGNFNPYGTMSRNDFTKTIVSMFFALDHDLKSAFPDVYEDSPYYSYIASGEARDIVAGYDDGYFYGDIILTEEMAFASIAQTLVDRKGYIYPDDKSFYLNSVSGGTFGSDWAEPGIALSVRDSIILPSESINPTGEISRQDAAVYLYRLFMLLEEKQQINFDLVEEISLSENKTEEKEESDQTLLYAAAGALALSGVAFALKGKKPEENG